MKTVLTATLLCGLLAGCVSSGGTSSADSVERVASGKPTFLQQTYMTMDERCRPVKRPTGVLTEPPLHGKVRMATRNAKAEYGPGDYQHCDGKLGPSARLRIYLAAGLSRLRQLRRARALR